MANFRDLLKTTKQQIREVDTDTADRLRGEGSLILDVREADDDRGARGLPRRRAQHGPADDVLQLPDVPGPFRGGERFPDLV